MAIKHLVESGQTAEVQQTTFCLDVVGRYVCNTLTEAVNNGGSLGRESRVCTRKLEQADPPVAWRQ
jgi:hypothetical protein